MRICRIFAELAVLVYGIAGSTRFQATSLTLESVEHTQEWSKSSVEPGLSPITINCTLIDPVHFRKIEFWSNSLIAR